MLHFIITRDELLAHLEERITTHTERSKKFAQEAEIEDAKAKLAIDSAGDDDQSLMYAKASSGYTGAQNARDQARQKSRSHARQALQFKWYADHLPAETKFELELMELDTYELIPTRF